MPSSALSYFSEPAPLFCPFLVYCSTSPKLTLCFSFVLLRWLVLTADASLLRLEGVLQKKNRKGPLTDHTPWTLFWAILLSLQHWIHLFCRSSHRDADRGHCNCLTKTIKSGPASNPVSWDDTRSSSQPSTSQGWTVSLQLSQPRTDWLMRALHTKVFRDLL